MGDYLQAPQWDKTPRHPKTASDLNRKPRKVAFKTLNSTEDISAVYSLSAENSSASETDSYVTATSAEIELVIKHLKEGRKSKYLNSSKKVLEALGDVIIEGNGGLYEENEWLDKLLSSKSNLAFLICIMAMLALLMVWFFDWISKEYYTGLTPT